MSFQINGLQFQAGPGGGLLTWHERPLMAAQYDIRALDVAIDDRPAIVMQGSVVTDLDFTLQTIELYRRLHPHATVVLSTWKDEDAATLARAEALGALVVTSDRPPLAGQQNVNLQIASTSAGVLAARAAGASHIAKTRTDQRLCAPDVLAFLRGLQQSYPLRQPGTQQARLVALSLNTFRYRMYGVSDMFLFGDTDDMVRYWTPPLDVRVFDPNVVHFRTLREFSTWRVCEVYLCTEYLQRIGWDIAWTLKDYWRVMADQFCVVDASALDLFWPKYSCREMRWMNYSAKSIPFTELGFRDWQVLHTSLDRIKHIPEELLG